MENIQQLAKYQKHLYGKELSKEKWRQGYQVRIGKVERENGMG